MEIDGQTWDFVKAYKLARGSDLRDYQQPGTSGSITQGSFVTIEDRRFAVEERGRASVPRENVGYTDRDQTPARDRSLGPRPLFPGAVAAATPGEPEGPVEVPEELAKLFEEFFALPRFRFDMPTRKDGDPLDTLVGAYAARYIRTIAPDERAAVLTTKVPGLGWSQAGWAAANGAPLAGGIGVQRPSGERSTLDRDVATRIARQEIEAFSHELDQMVRPPAGPEAGEDNTTQRERRCCCCASCDAT